MRAFAKYDPTGRPAGRSHFYEPPPFPNNRGGHGRHCPAFEKTRPICSNQILSSLPNQEPWPKELAHRKLCILKGNAGYLAARSACPYLNYNYDTKIDRDSQINIDIWDKFRYLVKFPFPGIQKALYFLPAFKEIERPLPRTARRIHFYHHRKFSPFLPF